MKYLNLKLYVDYFLIRLNLPQLMFLLAHIKCYANLDDLLLLN